MPIKIHHEPEPSLNLTPMIDIVFLLIIFFMVGTKFTEVERQVKLELPSVKEFGALTAAPQKRIVNVYEDNTIMMDGQEYALDELVTALRKAHDEYHEMSVLIRGDGNARHKHVTHVLAACRDAGFERLGIGVRAEIIRR
jgi:biopolymer transport protein ExbD